MRAIVAVSQSWGIGKDGHLLFRISADLQRFKALTTGHTVIMGRKTLESLPGGRGLPNRRNLVLTRQKRFIPDRAEAVHSLEELLALAGSDAFVIGGQAVYEQLLPHCDGGHWQHISGQCVFAEARPAKLEHRPRPGHNGPCQRIQSAAEPAE